jgi:homoserine O-acetyltransferase/O-succinyltransferase
MTSVHLTREFVLEDGTVLRNLRQAYTLVGHLNPDRDNLVLLFHSLTSGPDPRDWWAPVVRQGGALDPGEYAVLTPNLLGSCYGTDALPPGARVTTRDQARLVAGLVHELGVPSVRLAAGGSLGGMVALEWAATFPHLSRAVVSFAAPAAHTAWAIGLNHLQRRALELGAAAGRSEAGLELARMIAMVSYRTEGEFQERFGREQRDDGAFQIGSWLDHHGRRLRQRFPLEAYAALIDCMDSHDVGRGRGGPGRALRAFAGSLTAVGIPGDRLYPARAVRGWAAAAGARYTAIRSSHGHDAFLLEPRQVARILRRALAAAHRAAPSLEAAS